MPRFRSRRHRSASPTARTGPLDPTATTTRAITETRGARRTRGEGWIQGVSVLGVLAVALVAAAISYGHLADVVRAHGEHPTSAKALPITVDGLMVTTSMTLLRRSLTGRRSWPPYLILILASTASVAGNILSAEPTLTGRIIAAWPALALITSYEMLMMQLRDTHHHAVEPQPHQPTHVHQHPADDDPADISATHRRRPAPGATRTPVVGTRRPVEKTNPAQAPTPIPAGVLASAARSRPDSKRARFAALLHDLNPGDPRTDAALARDLAPTIDLHEGTARRYLAEFRRQTLQPAA